MAGQKLKHYGENIQVQLNNVKNEYLTNLKKNLEHRFRKEESEMINDLGHILEPSIVLSSENEVVKALECVSLFYGSDKTCQLVLGDFTEGDTRVEETNIGKLLDADKLKQEWPSLRGMINGSYRGLSTEALCSKVLTLHQELLPEFSKLCRIALCSGVLKKFFTHQKKLRISSLKTENLNCLINIHMSSEELEENNPAKAVKLWRLKKRREGRLTQLYKAMAPKELKRC